MINKDKKQLIIETLDNQLKPIFILVFGSYAKRTPHNNSDLDLAYYSEKTLTNYQRFLLAGDLSEKCMQY